jgi:hypothetical protein
MELKEIHALLITRINSKKWTPNLEGYWKKLIKLGCK